MKNLHINLIIVTLMFAIGYSHPPIVFDNEYTLDEDTQIFIDIYATHSYGYNVFINIVNEPEFGTLEITGGGEGNNTSMLEVLYIPNIDYYGNDSFTYNAIHNEYISEDATITLIINPVNDSSTVTDIDENVYETILIGDQLWMKENLKVTHYNDGSEIPTGYSISEWADLGETETGAYAIYGDNESNADTYGYMYNWYTVDDERGVCPESWHVPTDDEYTALIDYLGGTSVAAGKLKECTEGSCPESNYWISPNTGATNESGFTGLPGGFRFGELPAENDDGGYNGMGGIGYFWSSSTEDNNNNAWMRELNYYYSEIFWFTGYKRSGFSVRCLADTEMLGDLNGDGEINILDVVGLVNIILGISPENPAGDLNQDGVYNVLDIVQLVNIILDN